MNLKQQKQNKKFKKVIRKKEAEEYNTHLTGRRKRLSETTVKAKTIHILLFTLKLTILYNYYLLVANKEQNEHSLTKWI